MKHEISRAGIVVIACVGLSLSGCGNQGGGGPTVCAEATITGNGANNTFTALAATQCDVSISNGALIIDLLEGNDGTNPRVLFTLRDVAMADLTDGASFSLTRSNDELPEPAIYQEFTGPASGDDMTADGPFWTSNAGSLSISVDDTGAISGSFNFTADNPRPDMPSTATGTVTVMGGPIVLFPGTGGGGAGCGAFGAGGIAMMMLCLAAGTRFRRRR